jgi:hypothetical protein
VSKGKGSGNVKLESFCCLLLVKGTVRCVNKHYPSNCPVKSLFRITPNAEFEASILGLKESIYGASRESPEF